MDMYKAIDLQYQDLKKEERVIYNKLRFSEKIEGWLLIEEAVELYRLVVASKGQKAVFVEIGTWLGKSLSILAKASLDRGGAIVYGVDPFNGAGDLASVAEYKRIRDKLEIPQMEQCIKNLTQAGVSTVAQLLPFTSQIARQNFHEPYINGLFIDGNHEYESIMNDLNLWADLIVSGGWLVLHDVGAVHVNGPERAMKILKKEFSKWHNWKIVGEMAICFRR